MENLAPRASDFVILVCMTFCDSEFGAPLLRLGETSLGIHRGSCQVVRDQRP